MSYPSNVLTLFDKDDDELRFDEIRTPNGDRATVFFNERGEVIVLVHSEGGDMDGHIVALVARSQSEGLVVAPRVS